MIASKIVAAALVHLGCCSAANAPAKKKDPGKASFGFETELAFLFNLLFPACLLLIVQGDAQRSK
jgi:hypothetical protein